MALIIVRDDLVTFFLCQPNVSNLVFPITYTPWGGDIIVLILLIRKLRLEELMSFAQVETVKSWS